MTFKNIEYLNNLYIFLLMHDLILLIDNVYLFNLKWFAHN